MNQPDNDYRSLLQQMEIEQQRSYDKALFALSGGALGVSFAFVKDIVPLAQAHHICLLVGAWYLWGASLLGTLTSYFFSVQSLRAAIEALDKNTPKTKAHNLDRVTSVCNALSGVCFFVGVILLASFISLNVGGSMTKKVNEPVPTPTPQPDWHRFPVRDGIPFSEEGQRLPIQPEAPAPPQPSEGD